jgi:hypothetical protein
MNDLQQNGGVAALLMAAMFVVGFVSYLAFLAGSSFESSDPAEVAGFLADNQALLSIWHVLIYIVFGIALIVLSLGLYARLSERATGLAQTATAFGVIWAGLVIASGMIAVVGIGSVVNLYDVDPEQAGTVWAAISAVQFGVGGGVEIVGALWLLLISWAALRSGEFSRSLNSFGMVVGGAGVLTIIPALEIFGALFGLGSIAWFVWVGLMMLKTNRAPERRTRPQPSMAS